MKRHFVIALVSSVALAAPCMGDNFFKDALRNAAQGALGGGGGQQIAGQAAGNTNLPAGQYMMTNMFSGQGFYVTITPQGQMFAQDPRAVQVILQPAGQPLMNQGIPGGGGGGGLGGLLNKFGGGGGGGNFNPNIDQ